MDGGVVEASGSEGDTEEFGKGGWLFGGGIEKLKRTRRRVK